MQNKLMPQTFDDLSADFKRMTKCSICLTTYEVTLRDDNVLDSILTMKRLLLGLETTIIILSIGSKIKYPEGYTPPTLDTCIKIKYALIFKITNLQNEPYLKKQIVLKSTKKEKKGSTKYSDEQMGIFIALLRKQKIITARNMPISKFLDNITGIYYDTQRRLIPENINEIVDFDTTELEDIDEDLVNMRKLISQILKQKK